MFLVYINDLEEGIKSSVKFFAGDTSLFSIVRDPVVSAEELNHDLDLIKGADPPHFLFLKSNIHVNL